MCIYNYLYIYFVAWYSMIPCNQRGHLDRRTHHTLWPQTMGWSGYENRACGIPKHPTSKVLINIYQPRSARDFWVPLSKANSSISTEGGSPSAGSAQWTNPLTNLSNGASLVCSPSLLKLPRCSNHSSILLYKIYAHKCNPLVSIDNGIHSRCASNC